MSLWDKIDAWNYRRKLFALAFMGFVIVFASIGFYARTFGWDIIKDHEKWGQFGEYLGGTTNPLLGLLTFLGILWTISITYEQFHNQKSRQDIEDTNKRALFFFEQAKQGLEEVYDMLKDQNNDRVTWVQAARDLIRARNIGKSIAVPEYQEAYRLTEEKIRHKLYLALSTYDTKTQSRNPLPPQFFYGIKNWDVFRSLDDVAIEVSQEVKAYSVVIDQNTPQSSILPLAAKSVIAIYNFLDYPADYEDPLKTIEMWTDNWEESLGINEGAKRFVSHVTNNTAIGGKLFPRVQK